MRTDGRTEIRTPISHPDISRCDKNQHHFLDKLYPIVKFVCFVDLAKNTYWRGLGRIPDKSPCPPGLRDDGARCWKTSVGIVVTLSQRKHCRSDEEKYGALSLCYPKCKEGYVPQGCCICKKI